MLDRLLNWAESEWRDVRKVPASILLAGCLGGFIVHLHYSERIAAKDERIALLQESHGAKSITPISAFVVGLYGVVGVMALIAFGQGVRIRQLRRESKNFLDRAEAADVGADRFQQLTKERDELLAAWREAKRLHGMDMVEAHAGLEFKDGKTPRVTIRYYASYDGDYELAQAVEKIFTDSLKWPVTLDASNSPALSRADKYKVVFDVGMTYVTYQQLVHGFSYGNLLGVSVGWRHLVERSDDDHLIVLILPRSGAAVDTSIKAAP